MHANDIRKYLGPFEPFRITMADGTAWKHLVARPHPWRKQLYLKGRNMTVRQLVGGILADRLTEEQAAANWDLPLEAIREALAYAEQNKELLEYETAYERYLSSQRGVRLVSGPRP